MNLENVVKFHSAKSVQINDLPHSTSSETLTGTDVMAAMGMTQSRAALGYSAFIGKMGISSNDREKAIELLTRYAMKACDQVSALRRLDKDTKPRVMQILAISAYEDYARSAASVRQCDCCGGERFIEAEVFSMKTHTPAKENEFIKMSIRMGVKDIRPSQYEVRRQVREIQRVLCTKCKGKGVISNACRCNGKGVVLDEAKMKQQGGVPAHKTCSRCNGRGYSRLLPESVRRFINDNVVEIPETTWRRSYKDFFESLVGECIRQEEHANNMLKKVTR